MPTAASRRWVNFYILKARTNRCILPKCFRHQLSNCDVMRGLKWRALLPLLPFKEASQELPSLFGCFIERYLI